MISVIANINTGSEAISATELPAFLKVVQEKEKKRKEKYWTLAQYPSINAENNCFGEIGCTALKKFSFERLTQLSISTAYYSQAGTASEMRDASHLR